MTGPNSTENLNQGPGTGDPAAPATPAVSDPLESVTIEGGGSDPNEPGTGDETGTGKSEINQEKVNKKINKLTFQRHQEREKREAAEARALELEAKLNSVTAPKEVQVPELPDTFDPDYEAKIAARDDAIRKNAEFQANQSFITRTNQQQVADKQAAEAKAINELVDGMYKKADTLDISPADMKTYDDRVASFIKDPELAKFILGMENSPLILKYLAGDTVALDSLSRMGSLNAVGHLTTVISAKAEELKPGVTTTPDPLDIPGKKGAPKGSDPYLKGVQFE